MLDVSKNENTDNVAPGTTELHPYVDVNNNNKFRKGNKGRPKGSIQQLTNIEAMIGRTDLETFVKYMQQVSTQTVIKLLDMLACAAINTTDIELAQRYIKLHTNLMPFVAPKRQSISYSNDNKTSNDWLNDLDNDTRIKVINAMSKSKELDNSVIPLVNDATEYTEVISEIKVFNDIDIDIE